MLQQNERGELFMTMRRPGRLDFQRVPVEPLAPPRSFTLIHTWQNGRAIPCGKPDCRACR